MSDFWNPLQGLTSLVILLAIVFAVIYFIKTIREKEDGKTGNGTALDILNERYAKGEINKEEYDLKKADIQK